MKKKVYCYLCNSEDLKDCFSISDYPLYLVPLPFQHAKSIKKERIQLHSCNNCGHMQVSEPDSESQKSIYELYYNYYVVDSSEALVPYYRIPFIKFLDEIKTTLLNKSGDLLEIGCSSGEKVELFAGLAKSYTGIDPSERINTAKKKFLNHNFVQGYFPDDISDSKFDTVISQFNLEHILDINKFVSSVNNCCRDNGIFVMQVPDANFFLRTKQPNFLAHEHIQYFTKDTLCLLLQKNGFDPIMFADEGPSLICAAKKVNKTNFEIDKDTLLRLTNDAQKQASLYNQDIILPKEVIFYGVGPQLFWLISKYKFDMQEVVIVDDNPNYKGQFLPGYTNEIFTLTPDIVNQKKNIVLSLNNLYNTKVIEKIKNIGVACNVIFNESGNWKCIKL